MLTNCSETILEHPTHEHYPPVVQLAIQEKGRVYFNPQNAMDQVQRSLPPTTLTAFSSERMTSLQLSNMSSCPSSTSGQARSGPGARGVRSLTGLTWCSRHRLLAAYTLSTHEPENAGVVICKEGG